MSYLKHIDGIRAIAVFSIVLFHADFKIFEGGYIGVDIFFVISGFLITRLILIKIKQNNFTHFVNKKLFLYPINSFKSNHNILNNIRKNIISNSTINLFKEMNKLSNKAYNSIKKSDFNSFLSILRDSHDIKSSYSKGVSNKNIEQSFLYLKNKEVMPLKILGAGGRGFILFYCENKKKLLDNKINHLDFKII